MIGWLATYIIPFVVLLGVLVFVHESGHFLVAKYFKITVERFSIGFGPPIVSFKRGGTEYRIAWIPLGGYVKMAGDDPTDDAARNMPGSFLGADLWKRMLVVLAGPGVNLILPILVFGVLLMHGRTLPIPWVGGISSNTPAARSGLLPGDRVLDVNGTHVNTWDDMTALIRAHDAPVDLTVERGDKVLHFTIVPEIQEHEDEFGVKVKMPIIGIVQAGTAAVVDPPAESPAAKAGIQTGDRIVKIGDVETKFLQDLPKVAFAPGTKVPVQVERHKPLPSDPEAREKALDEKPETLTVTLDVPEGTAPTLESLGFRDAQLVISEIENDSPAEKAGVQKGDRLVAIDHQPLASYVDVTNWMSQQKGGSEGVLTLLRDGKEVEVPVALVTKSKRIPGASKPLEYTWAGFDLFAQGVAAPTFLEKYSNPFVALGHGLYEEGDFIARNVRAFHRIFQGKISVRDSIGGPIAIAHVTGEVTKSDGLQGFLEILGQMSVILGIMNLLPIPILDGGHLAFFTAEAVLRRPPSLRVREVAQQAGLLLLLAVMAFVLVNDVVTRIF
jgi:regulator of sigma E protease